MDDAAAVDRYLESVLLAEDPALEQALQRAADSRLAQEQACSGTSRIALFCDDGEDDQQIQVRLT